MKTVLGDVSEREIKSALCHEHICCFCEYLLMMSQNDYINFDELEKIAVAHLKKLKTKYNLNLFVDCTPINIGRNIELLKRISAKSGVHIVCSTGFYHTEETVLYNSSAETLAEHMVRDAKNINAGIIKTAVESENFSDFNVKLLLASAIAQKELDLPIVVHTNACNKNGAKALEILLANGAKPESITIGHLSDTEDIEYILEIAKSGCYIGLDRMYDSKAEEYIQNKISTISKLCDAGFSDKILLSHDAQYFNGFEATHKINENPRFSYIFEYIAPLLDAKLFGRIVKENVINMLNCK